MSKRCSDLAQNLADGITNRARTASRKEKSHGLMAATVSHNERARIAARTEAATVNDDLVRVADDVFFTLAATDLILHIHTGIDRPDRSRGRSCGAPTFFHRQTYCRGLNHAADGPDALNKTGGIHQAVPEQRDGSIDIRPQFWSSGKVCDDRGWPAAVVDQTGL